MDDAGAVPPRPWFPLPYSTCPRCGGTVHLHGDGEGFLDLECLMCTRLLAYWGKRFGWRLVIALAQEQAA